MSERNEPMQAEESTDTVCITFQHMIPAAEIALAARYPGSTFVVLDIKQAILRPAAYLRIAFMRHNHAIAFIPSIDAGTGIDLIAAAAFLVRAPHKKIIDASGNQLSLTPGRGALHILRVFLDGLALPFALAYFYLRTRFLLNQSRQKRGVALPSGPINRFVYLRTDTFEDMTSGGSVAHTVGVIKGLMNLGYEPVYISPYVITPVAALNIPLVIIRSVAFFRNLPELPLLLYSELLGVRLRRASINPISFIYQRYALNNFSGLVLSKRIKRPFVLEYNGSDVWVAKNWGVRLQFEKLAERNEIANLREATLIVVVSQPIKDELLGRGIDGNKILVNPNGVDPDYYSPCVDDLLIRRRHNLNEQTVIGFIGTFGRWHGAEVLADAFGRLLKEYPSYRDSVRLLMIGDGMTMPQVKEVLTKYSVGDACILAGRIPQDQGPEHLAACDILASPHVPNSDGTPFFGSPTKLFEYMAMGKGIVASDLDQIGEILEHDKTAWMVKPGDAQSLMLGLKRLIDDRQLRERLGKAARQEVVANYTWKEHTRKIMEKLKEVVGQS